MLAACAGAWMRADVLPAPGWGEELPVQDGWSGLEVGRVVSVGACFSRKALSPLGSIRSK